ncbi:MAG: LamG domain-containing protein, partial [Candidatus Peribacteraceae bacterium]|nr:LamG domain-containing protein [Candidatus Peribacteraceae bacterium]
MYDTDGDGLWDGWNITDKFGVNKTGELNMTTCPTDIDSDDDGLIDGYTLEFDLNGEMKTILGEMSLGTSPSQTDTDSDGLWDGLEAGRYYLDSGQKNILIDGEVSFDMHEETIPLKATDISIFESHQDADHGDSMTNPTLWDTDFDGLSDGEEDLDYDGMAFNNIFTDSFDSETDGYLKFENTGEFEYNVDLSASTNTRIRFDSKGTENTQFIVWISKDGTNFDEVLNVQGTVTFDWQSYSYKIEDDNYTSSFTVKIMIESANPTDPLLFDNIILEDIEITTYCLPETSPNSYDTDRDGLSDAEESLEDTYWFRCDSNSVILGDNDDGDDELIYTSLTDGYTIMALVKDATSLTAFSNSISILNIDSGTQWITIVEQKQLVGSGANNLIDITVTGGSLLWVLVTPFIAISDTISNVPEMYPNGMISGDTMTVEIPDHAYIIDASITLEPYFATGGEGTNNGATPTAISGSAMSFDGVDDYVEITELSLSTETNSKVTVEFWMYWKGGNSQMPIGFDGYDLWLINNDFGFNSGAGDLYGISSVGLENKWVHVGAIFNNGDITQSEIYIYGESQTMTENWGQNGHNTKTVSSTCMVSGWINDGNYKFGGYIDELRILNLELSGEEIKEDYEAGLNGSPYTARDGTVGWYHFDEYEGTIIIDETGNNDGTIYSNPVWTSISGPALAFDGNDYIEILDNPNLDITNEITVEAWIQWEETPIGSFWERWGGKTTSDSHEGYWMGGWASGTRKLMWGVGESSSDYNELISDNEYPLNEWVFFTGTFNNGEMKLYANGINIKHVTTSFTSLPSTAGYSLMLGKSSNLLPFNGLIDEVRILS